LALNRDQGSCYTIHIGINDLHFRTSTPSRPTCNAYAKASRSQRAQYPIRRHRVRDVTGCQSSGPCGITASNLRDAKACWHRANGPRAYPIALLPRARRRGAGGGGRRRGVDRAHPAGQTPPLGAAGRDSHQDTGTQTSTFCEYPAERTMYVVPLAPPTSELSPTCVTAAWCGPIAMVLAVGVPNNTT
jgi:hypothetical protein